ncbi:Uncharacterized membrane protein [Pseudoxanthobacter soli DSM 19599]|uniref:Uncharacterized membrane protein n=1 Tax=Pseudoxanthobacter soli DSM 19599 TaxID=1123029 RepID=A0A1M7ZFE8_9HYPH|nr:EamA family transporter [Pseudoxanthobacter soli]SHO63641.1 Uncharacterized membrane protein [Pseudoxanthobacter soli DSM 19599]
MPVSVMVLVLCGALLHATWNTLVKSGADTEIATALVAVGSAAMAALALPFVAPPDPASWPFLATSVVAQTLYFLLVAAAYRAGDMSLAYPLMRGTAPLLVALASGPLIGERLAPATWAGVVLICAGVLGMVAGRVRSSGNSRAAIGFAFANAAMIATYTLIDGHGVRISGSPAGYTLWIFMLTALPMVVWVGLRRGRALAHALRAQPKITFIGGFCNLGSYGVALWAMAHGPIAVVSALRETSILFATAISALVLHERVGPARYAATGLILAGVVVMRLL